MAELTMWFDTSDFMKKSESIKLKAKAASLVGIRTIAQEILRLSQLEVPFLTGELLASGTVQQAGEEFLVGYNKPYAAYQHEGHRFDGSHVIKQYSNNRKGDYLKDPIRMNKEILEQYFIQTIKKAIQ